MLQMLSELTKGWFFKPMEKFKDYFINASEVLEKINVSDCVEFGSTNNQTFNIYDISDSRKHIKYSCCFTTLFDFPVVQNVYDINGKLLYEYDFETWYRIAESKT